MESLFVFGQSARGVSRTDYRALQFTVGPTILFLFMEIRPHLVLGKQVVATAIGGPPPVHRL